MIKNPTERRLVRIYDCEQMAKCLCYFLSKWEEGSNYQNMNIVKFGGGTNSTAMLIGMWRKRIPIDLIIFSDTGGERPDTYEFRDIFSKWLVEHSMPPITTVEYYTKEGKRLTLEEQCLKDNCLPSIAYGGKSCSQKHKIRPTNKYCATHPECQKVWERGERVVSFIGYDAGEVRRVSHATALDEPDKKYKNQYPLYEWGWTRDDCKIVIADAGLPQPGKSSCFFCPSMKKAEIRALWERYPKLFERAVEMERNAAKTLKTVKGLGRNWSWENYKRALDSRISLFDFNDAPGGCLCGTPCGCYDG